MGTIKNFIRNAYCGEMMINTLHRVEGFILPKIISDEEAVKRYYKRYTGKEIDLSNPKTFSEKMNWYKLNIIIWKENYDDKNRYYFRFPRSRKDNIY